MRAGILAIVFCFVCAAQLRAGDAQIVAGAGPSTEMAQVFFDAFGKLPESAGTTFIVMPSSIKHAGGLKNSDLYLFGRTGRPLSAEEKAGGKREILLGRVPVGFAIGLETGIDSLSLDELRSIYSRKIVNWKQVGGADAPIFLAGRDPNEAVFSVLKEELPWFKEVTFDRVFAKDDDVHKFIASPLGRHAIVFGSKTQLPDKQVIKTDGFAVGIKVGLVYDQKNEKVPMVEAARRFSASPGWQNLLKKNGLMGLR